MSSPERQGAGESNAPEGYGELEGSASAPPARGSAEMSIRPESAQLRAEARTKKELVAEASRLNAAVSKLQQDLQQSADECFRKDDTVRRLEAMLHEERCERQELSAHYAAQLEDKDSTIRDLRRCLEAQRTIMGQALEEHSSAGQRLSQILERERRDWTVEREMLKSDLCGTKQLMQENEADLQRDLAEAKDRVKALETQLDEIKSVNERLQTNNDTLKDSNEELMADNQELRSASKKKSEMWSSHEKEIVKNKTEISELKFTISKLNERMQEDWDRADEELLALRNQLAKTIEERDRAVTELHAAKEKEANWRSIRSSSISSVGGVGSETNFLDDQVDAMKFELEEERATARIAQENWEAQLRVNRELEKEIEQLRENLSQLPTHSRRKSRVLGPDAIDTLYRTTLEVRDAVHSAISHNASIMTKGVSSKLDFHSSSLNVLLEEARHQLESIKSVLESTMDERRGELRHEATSRRQKSSIDRKHRSLLSVGNWTIKNLTSRHKANKEQGARESIDDLKKQIDDLQKDKFALEQCVRYLSSRCQLYQAAWKAREGPRMQHTRVTSLSGRYEKVSSSEASGDVHMMVRDEKEQQEIIGSEQRSGGSGSSRAGEARGDDSPRLPRNLKMKLINKISQVCEPFTLQHLESGGVEAPIAHPRSSRGVSSLAS